MNGLKRLWGWEGFLLAVLLIIMAVNTGLSDHFLTVGNQVNLFQLSVEKIIVAVIMTLIIINGEIDLSVASMMGLAACAFGWMFNNGVPAPLAIVFVLGIGALGGLLNAVFITRVGLPSLVVTLATLIGFRGIARILVEDRGISGFPDWFNALGQQALIGPFTLSLLLFVVIFIGFAILLHGSGFGRKVFVVGNNAAMAAYSGIDVASVKTRLFVASGVISALAGLLYAARVGAVRGDAANGFELDIITMVLLGGVSIFGGVGTLLGALLSILIVLNLRNGMALADVTGHIQTGVIGLLLILSVGMPNLKSTLGRHMARRTMREKTWPVP
jgi:rhamnose transport system permease protein